MLSLGLLFVSLGCGHEVVDPDRTGTSGQLGTGEPMRILDLDTVFDRTGSIHGTTVRYDTGEPVGPVMVGLLDLDALSLAYVDSTTPGGEFAADLLLPGRYVPLVYDRESRILHNPLSSLSVGVGDRLQVELPLIGRDFNWDKPNRRFGGRVIDAVTRLPIQGAMVDAGTSADLPQLSDRGGPFAEISGLTGSLNQPTDAEGRFELIPVWCFRFPSEGGFIDRTPDILVTRVGYKGHRIPSFDCNDLPMGNVEIALEAGNDEQSIVGQLVDLDLHPVAGLRVGLEWLPDPIDPPSRKVLVQGVVAISDEQGRFRFDGVPEGWFRALAAYPLDDGWVHLTGVPPNHPTFAPPVVEVRAGGEGDLGPLPLVPAMQVIRPAEGATTSGPVVLEWTGVETAERYSVQLQGEGLNVEIPDAGGLSLELPPEWIDQPGIRLWRARAWRGADIVGSFERFVAFEIAPSSPPEEL